MHSNNVPQVQFMAQPIHVPQAQFMTAGQFIPVQAQNNEPTHYLNAVFLNIVLVARIDRRGTRQGQALSLQNKKTNIYKFSRADSVV